jgi:uncharacterized coiled-coil DUF342 family protein
MLNEHSLDQLLYFLGIVFVAVNRLMSMTRKNTPAATQRRIETQEMSAVSENGNGYASVRQTVDVQSKRQDDMLDELREFKRDMRDELRARVEELRDDSRKRHSDFMELSRRRDDGWIKQFSDFSRQYRTDNEKRDEERSRTQSQITLLQTDIGELQKQIAEIRQMLNPPGAQRTPEVQP